MGNLVELTIDQAGEFAGFDKSSVRRRTKSISETSVLDRHT
jgi:hypothetical protein